MQLLDLVADRKRELRERLRQQVRRRRGNKVQRAAKRYDEDGHSKGIAALRRVKPGGHGAPCWCFQPIKT